MEKRLQTSLVEKDTLCASLEESFEKIHVLQRQMREQDMKLQTTQKTSERLKRENDTLCERLESVITGYTLTHLCVLFNLIWSAGKCFTRPIIAAQ